MKTIIKYFFANCCFLLILISCDENDNRVVFDVNNGQPLANIVNGTTQTLPVPDAGATALVQVGVSTVSDSDRTISVSIDTEASTADPTAYSLNQSTLVIPAGSFVGNVEIDANFSGIPEVGLVSVVVNLDNVEGQDVVFQGTQSQTINLFRFCEFTNGSTFLGDYELNVTVPSANLGDTFVAGVVTLTEGATVADRTFSASLFPAFGGFGPFQFSFSLICDDVVVPNTVGTGLGCTAPEIVIGPPTTSASYNSGDDSTLLINFTEDPLESCGPAQQVQIQLTKI